MDVIILNDGASGEARDMRGLHGGGKLISEFDILIAEIGSHNDEAVSRDDHFLLIQN